MSSPIIIDADIQLTNEGAAAIEAYYEVVSANPNGGEHNESWWKLTAASHPILKQFADVDSDRIPRGGYGSTDPTQTLAGNRWEFTCADTDKDNELEKFLAFLPLIATAANIVAEDDDGFTTTHTLQNGVMVEVERTSKWDDPQNYWG